MSSETNISSAGKPQYTTCKLWQLFLYPLVPAVSNLFMVFFMMNSYIANGGYGLAVATAAVVSSYANIFDAITDPLVAVVVPKINTRFGAARPIIMTGYLVMALSTLGIAYVFPGKGIIPYALCYFGYIFGRTILNQGKNIASNILTNEPRQRPLIGRASAIYTLVLAMIMSIYRSKVLYPIFGGLTFELLQVLGLTAVIAGFFFVLLGCIAISPTDTHENIAANYRPGVKISLVDIFRMLRHNKAFLMGVISDASDKMASEVASASTVTTLLFGVLIGNYKFSGSISIYTTIVSIVLIFYITGLARKMGAGKAYVTFTKVACVVVLAMFTFMMVVDYTQISINPIITVAFVILYALLSASKTTTNSCVLTMYQDIADYEFYLTGKYMPGLVVASINMLGKIMKSVGDLVLAGLLAWAGYVSTTPQPGDPATGMLKYATLTMWLGLPLLGWLISIIAMHWYPLTPEKMVEVQAVNAQRRAENRAAAEAEAAKTASKE